MNQPGFNGKQEVLAQMIQVEHLLPCTVDGNQKSGEKTS